MLYINYLILAALVVVLSFRLSFYVDEIDKKTNLSGALIGGVILAAVTSLPELFTSFTAVLQLNQPNLVQGNILGSNIFNITILGALVLFSSSRYSKAKISKSQFNNILFGLAMYTLVLLALNVSALFIHISALHVNIASILILGLYAISIFFMSGDHSASNEEASQSPLTIQQVVLRFALYALALIVVSIVLTTNTDRIATELQLGATVAGAIFLGVATSLPELASCISLVRMGNYNAAMGNVIGSNIFNFAIFAFADIIYFSGNIFIADSQATNLVLFGMLNCVIALALIKMKKNTTVVRILAALIVAVYVVSIVIGL
ncbi:MAG: sodium:calcium antiporter [Erysipelotrichaceae bacterium]